MELELCIGSLLEQLLCACLLLLLLLLHVNDAGS